MKIKIQWLLPDELFPLMKTSVVLRLGFSLIAFIATSSATAGVYTYSKIGYPESFSGLSIFNVNANGQYATNLYGYEHAMFVWSPDGKLRVLQPIDRMQSDVSDVNESGVAVGQSTPLDDFHYSRATVWYGDKASLLPGLGGDRDVATAINEAGLIVGYSRTPDTGLMRAVWWDGGGIHELRTADSVSAAAFNLNNGGTIIGATRFSNGLENGTVWANDVATYVGTLGGDRSVLRAVNNRGWAVGDALLAGDDENWRAVLWDGTSLHNLGTLGGGQSWAYGIGEDGTVYGSAMTAGAQQHAAVWRNGTAIDLNELIVNPADLGQFLLTAAMGADSDGNIYGDLYDEKNNRAGVFILAPVHDGQVPEPGSLPTFASGLLGTLALTRRRSKKN